MSGMLSEQPTPDTQLFQDAFNASPIGIVVENLEGQPLFVNQAFCAMLGFSEQELRKKHCVDFSPPEDAAKDWALFQQLRAGSIDHYQIEKRYFRRDGSLVWGRLSLSLLNHRPSPMVIAMVEDITEQKRAEEARFRHSAIVESSEDAIASGTLDGIIVSWNPGAEKMYGYTEAEAVGRPITFLVPPELPDEEHKILERLKAGGRIEHFETVRVTKAGKRINVSLTISPIKDSSGRIVGISGIARDITDRKRAEAELAKANERLCLAIESGSIGGWDYEPKTGKNDWFGNAHAQLGMRADETSGSSKEFWERVHAEDRERLERALQAAKDRHEEFAQDFRVVWRDGTSHWLRSRGRYHYAANGEPERMLGLSVDITDRKLAEEARFRLAAIVKSSEDAIVSKDLDGMVTSWNAGAQHIFGYTEQETIGRPINLIPPELQEDESKVFERLKAGERIDPYDTIRLTKGGRTVNVSVSLSPIKDARGAIVGYSKIARDITERKRAEEAVRESEQTFRSVFSGAGVGMVIVSPEGRFLAANKAFCDCLGYTEEELLEKTVESITWAEDWPAFSKKLREALTEGRGFQWFEKRCLHKSGRIIYTQSSASLIQSRRGLPKYFVAEVLDVTNRKQAEQALAEMTRKLVESQEQERTRIGRELHDDISQRLAMLALELEQLQQNPSEVQSRLPELRKRTIEICSDVQALSHDLHSSRLEYLGVVAGIKGWCKEFGERHAAGISFSNDVPGALPLEIGLPLFRVVQEALHNAVKHSGVKDIEVRLWKESSGVHLTIVDNGVGFDVETAMQGPGLGLTSMRERVRLVNGTIEIDSEPNRGTTIHVRVPLDSERSKREAV